MDEIVGLPGLPRLLVQLDLLRDENPKRCFGIFSDVGLGARPGGRGKCIYIVISSCCAAGTNTTLVKELSSN